MTRPPVEEDAAVDHPAALREVARDNHHGWPATARPIGLTVSELAPVMVLLILDQLPTVIRHR